VVYTKERNDLEIPHGHDDHEVTVWTSNLKYLVIRGPFDIQGCWNLPKLQLRVGLNPLQDIVVMGTESTCIVFKLTESKMMDLVRGKCDRGDPD
jgi:hypothetical protein